MYLQTQKEPALNGGDEDPNLHDIVPIGWMRFPLWIRQEPLQREALSPSGKEMF